MNEKADDPDAPGPGQPFTWKRQTLPGGLSYQTHDSNNPEVTILRPPMMATEKWAEWERWADGQARAMFAAIGIEERKR